MGRLLQIRRHRKSEGRGRNREEGYIEKSSEMSDVRWLMCQENPKTIRWKERQDEYESNTGA